MLKEFITTLMQAVIIAVVPLLTTYLVKWLNAKVSELSARVENDKTRAFIQEASDAIRTAVTYTSQTYVDKLKAQGEFSAEGQKEALELAKTTALSLLSQSAKDFLASAYGDAAKYLEPKIEHEIRAQKTTLA